MAAVAILLLFSYAYSLADSSRNNPLHIYDIAIFNKGGILKDECTIQLVIKNVIFGSTATKIIKDANFFNASPEEGKEYCLAYFSVVMQSADADQKFTINKYDFEVVSKSGKVYEGYSHSVSGLEDSATIYSGGSADFVVPMYIDKGDIPLLLYNDQIWFSTDDKNGTRANSIKERGSITPNIPKGVFAINKYFYIGMDITYAKELISALEDISPSNEYIMSKGNVGASVFEDVTFEEINRKCTSFMFYDLSSSKVNTIAFVLADYPDITLNKILNEYDLFLENYCFKFGKPIKEVSGWSNQDMKKYFSIEEGAAIGYYVKRYSWNLTNIYIEYCLDTDLSKMGIVNDDYPRIWIAFCDVSIIPDLLKE